MRASTPPPAARDLWTAAAHRRHPAAGQRRESATSRSASAERRKSPSSFGENAVSRIGTAPALVTIEGTESATPDTDVVLDRIGTGAFSAEITPPTYPVATSSATSSSGLTYYQASADVTALVQANGVGQYRMSGVDGANLINLNNDTIFIGW